MSKSQRSRDEIAAFAAMAEADLLELRVRLQKEINVLVNERGAKASSIQRITTELIKRQSPDAVRMAITDHAVVRYIERLEGRDLEGVRTKILEMVSRSVRRDAEFLDDPVTGMVIACREGSNSVATILDKDAVRRPTPKLVKARD
jgi:hypothetical protein